MRDPTALFRGSPPRASKTKPEEASPYGNNSSFLSEISSLRSRLRELEDDTKSSVVGFSDDDNGLSPNVIRKRITKLEQEKATQEKEFLNQMASLATENQKRIVDLQAMLAASESRNLDLQEQLGAKEKVNQRLASDKDQLVRIIDEQREKHTKEIEQMKTNLESTDMEITESRGEIDQLHEQLEELQTHRETLIDEVTSCRVKLVEEQRKNASLKSELSSTKLSVEKLQAEIKHKDDKIKQKDFDLDKLTKGVGELKGAKKDFAQSSKKTELLENEIKEKDELLKQQRDEISEMNENIIDLQDHKEMLMLEVTDLRMELQKREKSVSNEPKTGNSDSQRRTLLSEKRKLENEVKQLTERSTSAQKKIVEKDNQIRNLSNSLIEERKTNSKMRTQLSTLEAESTKTLESSSLWNEKECKAEIASLRNQIKNLEQELLDLKKQEENRNTTSASLPTGTASSRPLEQRKVKAPSPLFAKSIPSVSSFKDNDESSVSSRGQSHSKRGTSNFRLTVAVPAGTHESRQPTDTPRTPVSGLVASFEKRIANKKSTADETLPFDAGKELVDELEQEKALAQDLEKQLKREKELVASLKEKLANEHSLPSTQVHSSELLKKVDQNQQEVSRLQAKVNELEIVKKKQLEELDLLRSEIVYNDVDRTDLEKKTTRFQSEIKRLQNELERVKQQNAFEDEKKEEEILNEIQHLQNQIKERDDALSQLKQKIKLDEEANDEKNFRLRTQLMKKEEEFTEMIDSLSKEIEDRNVEIASLKLQLDKNAEEVETTISPLRAKIGSSERELQDARSIIAEREDKIASLESDISSLVKQTSSAALEKETEIQILSNALDEMKEKNSEIEAEYTKSIKDLEDKIFALELKSVDLATENDNLKSSLETAEFKINNEISANMQQQVDEERDSLTLELTTTQIKFAELEMEHANRVKELEERIKVLEGTVELEAKEKQIAMESLEDVVKKSELEASPQVKRVHDTEINRITVELTKTQIKQADLEREYSNKIKDLELEIEELEVEAEEELKQKDKQIDELKQALDLKEDEVRRLENERTHLCASMNDMSFSRNDEVHELQAEVIDLSTRSKAQEREIQMLKMKLQEYETSADNLSTKYEQRIKDLEDEINDLRIRAKGLIDPDTVATVKSENAKLRECVRDLKMERRSLNERLEVLLSERNGSKSTQILQKRNQVLKDEVEKLTKRLKKLEASITRFAI